MRTWRKWIWLALLLPALVACHSASAPSSPARGSSAAVAGEKPQAGAMLAYEHSISIDLPAAQIADRVTAVRDACAGARFGACNILSIDQKDRSAALSVRIVPAGVEPLSKLASQGGTISSRQTKAEDLTQAVQDNQRQQALLNATIKRLAEVTARKDITAADLITLIHAQADAQAQLQDLEKAAAQQQQRIDTNLLEMSFTDSHIESPPPRSPFADMFKDTSDNLAEGISDAVNTLVYIIPFLPFLLVALLVCLLWRWTWRKLTGKSRKSPTPASP